MEKRITPNKVKRLWKKMGNRASLASRLGITEMTVYRWENNKVDINDSGYRFEVKRLLEEYKVN